MHPLPLYEDRLVAFIDILGFANLVTKMSKDQELHKRVHKTLTFLQSHRESWKTDKIETSDLEISVFSDSIAISSEIDAGYLLFWNCAWLQSQLLLSGILTRGGISVGPTFHKSDVLYGEGMLKAYQIECKAAVYPRLVVDPEILPRLEDLIKMSFLNQDTDGLWFINFFRLYADGDLEEEEYEYENCAAKFEKIGNHISLGTKNATQADHLAKWKWIENRYEVAKKDYVKKRNCDLNLTDLLLEKLGRKREQD